MEHPETPSTYDYALLAWAALWCGPIAEGADWLRRLLRSARSRRWPM